tara:strand:- start:4061 stop:4234 length:174 start_codon:yes stop_codon:yes gene_type:complete
VGGGARVGTGGHSRGERAACVGTGGHTRRERAHRGPGGRDPNAATGGGHRGGGGVRR